MCILLAIVTLGIYAFVWVYRTHKEVKTYSGQGLGGGLGLLIFFLVGLATYFLVPYEVEANLYNAEGEASPVRAVTGFWVFPAASRRDHLVRQGAGRPQRLLDGAGRATTVDTHG
jgi:hypothetical protein